MRPSFRLGCLLLSLVALITPSSIGCRSEVEPTRKVDLATDKKVAPKTAGKSHSGTAESGKNTVVKNSRLKRIRSAASLLENGPLDQAEPMIRKLMIEFPDDAEITMLMVHLAIQKQDIETAVSLLDQMATIQPKKQDDLAAHAANLLYQNGMTREAMQRFDAIVERTPEFDEARRRYGQILNQRGFTFDANKQIRVLISRRRLGQDELISLLYPDRSWLGKAQIESATSEYDRQLLGEQGIAAFYRIKGDPRKSLECLAKSQLLEDKDPAACALYVRVLAETQRYEQLEQWIASSTSEWEQYPNFWIACGNLARKKGSSAAINCFVSSIKLEPHCLDAFYGLIESLESLKKSDLAERLRLVSQSLDSIRRDGKKIRDTASTKPQEFVDLATQLMNVGRPLEAIAWQEFALAKFSPNSKQRELMPGYKSQVLKRFPSGCDESVYLCDLDTQDFDSETQWLASVRVSHQQGFPRPAKLAPNNKRQETPTPPVFVNTADDRGIRFRYKNAKKPVQREFQIFQAFGGGVACLDFDRDGHIDFYFGQAACTPPDGVSDESNGLFRGLGNQHSNVIVHSNADDRGYTVGVSAGDWNQDGFADLMIGNLGKNQLLINQGDGTFQPLKDDSVGLTANYTSSVAIADVSGDGLPDIVEINYLDDPAIFEPIRFDSDGKPVSLPGPLQFQAGPDRMLISNQDGTLSAQPLGNQASKHRSTGLALLVTDINDQVGNEVFVANDLRANQLWIHSTSDTSWSDAAVSLGVAYGNSGKPMACMGIAASDFDANGKLDLHITNFEKEWSNHYLQDESGVFMDATVRCKLDTISYRMLGFGVQAIDYDNDSVCDLIVGNGHIEDMQDKGSLFAMPTQLLAACSDGFQDTQVGGDDEYWHAKHFSRAIAKCDVNRDGRIDVVVTDLKTDAVLLENQSSTKDNHWLQLELVGRESERDAIGAKITVDLESKSIVQVIQSGDGYLAKNESVAFFGLGKSETIEKITVRWPSGNVQVFRNMSLNTRWQLVEGEAVPWNLWVNGTHG